MKNNITILYKAIALIFILQTPLLQPIQMPSCLMEFNQGTGVDYIENCEKIDKYIQKNSLLKFSCATKSDAPHILNSIQKQLTNLKTEILSAEQKALRAIKEKYQISNEVWIKYEADVHRVKTIYTQSMMQAHPNTVHDSNIPAEILEILTNLLQQNNINLHSIHIKMVSDQEKISKNPNLIARAITYLQPLETPTDHIISYEYIPSTIEIFPRIYEKSMSDTIATCAHEVQHLVQHHGLTDAILMQYFEHYCNINKNDFENSSEYHTFAQIHEAQAEILSAIKDPKIAECLKIQRQIIFYPDHLYEDHFFHLAYIDSLWKMHEWLENFIS